MNGWAASGKFVTAKNTPLQTHMGTITTFMMPETPSMVRARHAVRSPRPPKARAPTRATTTRVAKRPSFPTPKTQAANPRSAVISRARNASRDMTSDARKCERRMGVAIIRFSSLRDRATTMPKPSPTCPSP